jgi:hemerythrin
MTDKPGTGGVMGAADVEAEHARQFELLEQVESRFAAGEFAEAREGVRELFDYTEAHFASEQVLMRQYAYPGCESHEREHGELLLALRQMHAQMELESPSPATDAAAIRRWLTAHIQNSDRAFLQYASTARPTGPH